MGDQARGNEPRPTMFQTRKRKPANRVLTVGTAVVVAVVVVCCALLLHLSYTFTSSRAANLWQLQRPRAAIPKVEVIFPHLETGKNIPTACSRGVPPELTSKFCCEESFHCGQGDNLSQVIPCSKCDSSSSLVTFQMVVCRGEGGGSNGVCKAIHANTCTCAG